MNTNTPLIPCEPPARVDIVVAPLSAWVYFCPCPGHGDSRNFFDNNVFNLQFGDFIILHR